MTDNRIEKIRAEIERRIEEEQRINKEKEKLTGVGSIIDTRYESFLSFVDSLQEDPVSEGLEVIAHRYYEPNDTFMDGFKKGAEWQKQQMKVTINLHVWY